MSRIIEMSWTCDSCKASNRGRDMECQECGSPKEDDEEYVMPSDTTRAPTVTDKRQLTDAKAGPNWSCEYCEGSVRNNWGECAVCGGPKTETAASTNAVKSSIFPVDPLIVKANRKPLPKILIPLGIASVVILSLSLVGWLFTPRTVSATVAETRWQRVVYLQQRQTNHGSGWDDQVPVGAFNETCQRRQHGTANCHPHSCNCRQVTDYCSTSCNCHEQCSSLGNGYASCNTVCSTCETPCGSHEECSTCYDQCPVYDDWCEYSYFTWPVIDKETTSGTDHNPYWGNRLQAMPEFNQRLTYDEAYTVVFSDSEERWKYRTNRLTEYSKFHRDANWLIKVNLFGHVWPQEPET